MSANRNPNTNNFRGGPTRAKLSSIIIQHTAQDEVDAILANNKVKWENGRKRKEAREAKRAKVTLAKMPWEERE